MKKLMYLAAALLCCIAFFSCEEKPVEEPETPETPGIGFAIINNGNWGGNDASVTVYEPITKKVTSGAFAAANGQKPGDLAQDILAVGDYVYIAMNGSRVVFVTDRDLKIKATVTAAEDGADLSPRCLTQGGGKVYVTYYEGYLGEIDPSDGWKVRTTKVGPNPEGCAYAAGNIYVANSGGYLYPVYNNTVSVVSASSFKEISTIEVNCNPAAVAADAAGKHVYVSSLGNYADIPSKLQLIDAANNTVSDLDYENVSAIAAGKDDILYILCGGYDEQWNILPGTVYKHSAANNTELGKFTQTSVPQSYSLSADTVDGYVFVGSSDYTNTGDMYIFNPDGTLLDSFDTGGMNPLKAINLL